MLRNPIRLFFYGPLVPLPPISFSKRSQNPGATGSLRQ
jgi:hypothetical protein